MKYIFALIFLLGCEVYAQVSAPSSYTTFLKLRKYALDAFPGADSLNANADAIDTGVKRNFDSLAVHAADIYTVVKYTASSGGLTDRLVNGVVYPADLSTTLDTSLVKTTGNDNVYGSFNYYGANSLYKHVRPLSNEVYWLASVHTQRWLGVRSKYVFADQFIVTNPSDATDTLIITYADGVLNIPLTIQADTVKGLSTISHATYGYVPSDVNDSSITIGYTNDLQFLLPGANMTNLEEIIMNDMPSGDVAHHLYIWINVAVDFNVTFHDVDGINSADGNMQLSGDFNMDAGDMLHLVWEASYDTGMWIEEGRSSNR